MLIKNRDLSKKGFTLVELLIVVAILGILAAVGVVAYTGFMGTAKENATKTNHANIVSYMQAEITKCSIGDATLNLVNEQGDPDPFDCTPQTDVDGFINAFLKHFKGSFTNPHNAAVDAVESNGCPNNAGVTGIQKENENTIAVSTKYEKDESCLSAVVGVE